MTTITPAVLDQYQIDKQKEPEFAKELGQDEFLELMMAQLKNQDPMKPMDNGEFLGQMAQFSTVSGIEDMQKSLETLTQTYAAGQTLQTTSLVGREVLIEDSTIELVEGELVQGSFELDAASGDVKLDITDSAGVVVNQISLGEFGAGRHAYIWDGMNNRGERMPAGKYTANVTVRKDDGYEAVTVLSSRIVESVEFGAGSESKLNTLLGDVLTLTDIRETRNVEPTHNKQQ